MPRDERPGWAVIILQCFVFPSVIQDFTILYVNYPRSRKLRVNKGARSLIYVLEKELHLRRQVIGPRLRLVDRPDRGGKQPAERTT